MYIGELSSRYSSFLIRTVTHTDLQPLEHLSDSEEMSQVQLHHFTTLPIVVQLRASRPRPAHRLVCSSSFLLCITLSFFKPVSIISRSSFLMLQVQAIEHLILGVLTLLRFSFFLAERKLSLEISSTIVKENHGIKCESHVVGTSPLW